MTKLSAVKGDITRTVVDAIVNAANTSLMGGGGVDGAIHRAGGPVILEDCRKIVALRGGCQTGEAVITRAGLLPSRFVIHTVGPVWNGGNRHEAELLASCYRKSLALAIDNRCMTIAFPGISTGIYRFPKQLAAQIAVSTTVTFLGTSSPLSEVIFVCFEDDYFEHVSQHLTKYSDNF